MAISKSTFIVLGIALFIGAICFAIWMIRWQFRAADTRVERWAQEQGYRLVDKQSANPAGTGPMYSRGHNTQVMYRVVVEDAQGTRRRALITIGSQSRGVLSDDFNVVWEDAPK
jgi:hypothetical protein